MVRLKQAPARLTRSAPRLRAAPKVALPFYQSPEWPAKVAQLINQRGRRCEMCGAEGQRAPTGDHIKELRDGGAALDDSNIQLLCAKCHGKKTAARRRERFRLG